MLRNKVLSHDEIVAIVKEQSDLVGSDFWRSGAESITLVPILSGAYVYGSLMLQFLTTECPVTLCPVVWSKHSRASVPSSTLQFNSSEYVLILDACVESGETLEAVYRTVQSGPATSLMIRSACLLCRPSAKFRPSWVGKVWEDGYLVGFGLDSKTGFLRGLPDIHAL